MQKKITIEQLRPGMFVHDLNCGWLDHPFARNRFRLTKLPEIEKLRELGIRELYIDTERGDDVPDAPTLNEIDDELDRSLDRVLKAEPSEPEVHTLSEELVEAKRVASETSEVIHHVMEDIRLGRQVDVERVTHVINDMTESILRNKDAMLGLGRIRKMDHYTYEHSVGVSVLMVAFAKEQGYATEKIVEIGTGGLLHDIGKMRIPDEILNKPGRLTDSEFAIMKRHVVFSAEILQQTPGISADAFALAAQHHERHDGSGYPDGLAGDAISPFGQMAAIVDVYDALSADRIYHRKQEPTLVLKRLLEWSKYHFNESLVHRFIRCVGIYPVGTLVRLSSGRLAVVVGSGDRGPLYPVVRAIADVVSRRYIDPFDIDLSSPEMQAVSEKIECYEDEYTWGIRAQDFLS